MEEEDNNFILSSTTSTQVVNITQDAQSPKCYICKRNFRTNRGLLQQMKLCIYYVALNIPGSVYQKDLEETYEQKVYWWKNVFMVRTGASEEFINEIETF